jgi:Uroporphyrinogen decarboxylase (URO-D)
VRSEQTAWCELSPSERLEARWTTASNLDLPFVGPEAEELYKARVLRLKKAWTLDGVPDRVPSCVSSNLFPFLRAGLTPYDAMYDYRRAADAWVRCNRELEVDMAVAWMSLPGPAFDVIGSRCYSWPGHGLAKESAYQYHEGEWMLGDEYDHLISDPSGFLLEVYLPRTVEALGGLALHGALGDMVEIASAPNYLATWGHPEMRSTVERLTTAGSEVVDWLGHQARATSQSMAEGFPALVGGFAFAPFDFVGDTLRGTRQVCVDMYRRPGKLLEAVDKMVPLLLRWLLRRMTPQTPPIVVIPLHKGTDDFMSDEQFGEFYWPSLRRFLDGIREAGLMAYLHAEGPYNTRLEFLRQLSPGTTIWHFDQTDLREAKEALSGIACVQGDVPLSLLQLGTPKQVTEYCRQLIEDVAPGGGYVLDAGAALDEAEDANVRAMIRAAREYGAY